MCLSVFRCVFGCVCVCVECVICYFSDSVTIGDFQFCRPKFFRVNLVECVFAILLKKYLSYNNNI